MSVYGADKSRQSEDEGFYEQRMEDDAMKTWKKRVVENQLANEHDDVEMKGVKMHGEESLCQKNSRKPKKEKITQNYQPMLIYMYIFRKHVLFQQT